MKSKDAVQYRLVTNARYLHSYNKPLFCIGVVADFCTSVDVCVSCSRTNRNIFSKHEYLIYSIIATFR
jgi:hypothetical protein